jgi:hypothetical protein
MRRREFLVSGCALAARAEAASAAVARQIKITGLETDRLRFPPGRRYYDAIHEFGAGSGAVVRLLEEIKAELSWPGRRACKSGFRKTCRSRLRWSIERKKQDFRQDSQALLRLSRQKRELILQSRSRRHTWVKTQNELALQRLSFR